jgi:prepilin peptidase dependent protein B
MTKMSHILMKAAMPAPSLLALMEQLANRLSPQAGKSLVISRKRERGSETRCASFTSMQSGQRGMSLIELMIALTMGLFLLLGLSTFLTSNIKSNTAAVRLASLDQELRAIMTLMTRDVRRTGYWGSPTFSAASGVYASGALSMIGAGSAAYAAGTGSTFANIAGPAISVNGAVVTAQAAAGCLLYSYDINNNSVQDLASGIDERYGFLLNNGAVMMRTGVGATSFDCTTAASNAWDYLSDQKNTNITALTFTETDSAPVYMCASPLAAGCTSGPNIRTRQINITITGQPLNDPGITQTLTETVKIENDLFKQN